MSYGFPCAALVVAAVLSCGCALHHPNKAASEANVSAIRAAGARVGSKPVDSGLTATLEAQDPLLTEALLRLLIAPTAAAHRQIAERYFRLRVFDAAYDHFARARDLDTKDGAAYEGLARVWRTWGFAHMGLGDAYRSVHYAPQSPAAHNTLGTILLSVGQPAAARPEFEQALALEPHAAYVLNNLCYLSFLEGAMARAQDECQAALASSPEFVPARNNLALVYAATNREDLAGQEFRAGGDGAAASYNLGMVLLAEQQYAIATKAFDAASRQRPSWSAPRALARRTRALAAAAEQ